MTQEKNKKLFNRLSFAKKERSGLIYPAQAGSKPTKESALKRLKILYKSCQQCPLSSQGRTQVVFGHGNPNAQLMLIGEGPGRNEDLQGEPFVGRAGRLLNKIIEAMGLRRKDVYISNVVKCRPPSNRTPQPNEAASCTNILLFKEIEIINPKVICTLGSPATKALLGQGVQISKARGVVSHYKRTPVIPTYHPAYLLRNPAAKRLTWADMQKVMLLLKQAPPKERSEFAQSPDLM